MSCVNKQRLRSGRVPLTGLITLLLIAFSVVGLEAHRSPPKSECPQPRFTGKAPADLYARVNPLEANRRNRNAWEELFEDVSNPSCVACHGKNGEGDGQLAGQFDPPPRNFAWAATIDGISDGHSTG